MSSQIILNNLIYLADLSRLPAKMPTCSGAIADDSPDVGSCTVNSQTGCGPVELQRIAGNKAVDRFVTNQIWEGRPGAHIEPPRVYRRVNLSKDGPYDTEKAYADLHG